jgi:hypothetical protein
MHPGIHEESRTFKHGGRRDNGPTSVVSPLKQDAVYLIKNLKCFTNNICRNNEK